MATFIVMLGPPGVGKGTQAKILSEKTGLAHISSGDLFRENLKNETELGKLAQTYMTKGELVPDDVTVAMIKDRLTRPDCKAGAVLDGFPRTPAQAEALEIMLKEFNGQVDVVPFITAGEEVLIERLGGR
jgi:adenylate kinase